MSGRKNKVVYVRPEEPAFLRRIKAKIGYQEEPNVDTKKEELEEANEKDYQDREDERPTLVLLEDSKVTESEANRYLDKLICDDKKEADKNKRILFKKPEKKQDKEGQERVAKKRPLNVPHNNTKSLKLSNNLLSFGDEEEEEEADGDDDTET